MPTPEQLVTNYGMYDEFSRAVGVIANWFKDRANTAPQDAMSLKFPQRRFAILDAVLSPEAVCISEPNYGIRCIELASGKQLFHHRSLGSNHVTYCSADGNFYCVALAETPPRNCSLITLAPNPLDCDRIAVLGQYREAVFFDSGNAL